MDQSIQDVANIEGMRPPDRSVLVRRCHFQHVLRLDTPAQEFVAEFSETFRKFSARQRAPSVCIDQVMQKLQAGIRSSQQGNRCQ